MADALHAFASRSGTPTIIVAPPASPMVSADPSRVRLLAEIENRLRAEIGSFDSLHWLGDRETKLDQVESPYDEGGDRVGHIPYTSTATASLATAVARRIHAIKSPPYKVIALDCDNTLWKGVVGEDGPRGITLGPGMKALQEFVVEQQAAGMVVCLVSKNAEADVLETFEIRDDFPLRRDHLVSWRIGWESKSKSLVELAEDLNLGSTALFSSTTTRSSAPKFARLCRRSSRSRSRMTKTLPPCSHQTWAFDRLKVTEEDRKRTEMYRVNANRTRLESQAADIGSFLASLELKVDIGPPAEDQWSRVAQLTQRTNQFNFSTLRRARRRSASSIK